MKLGILMALSVTVASLWPRSEAQINKLTPGTVVSWGQQVIRYVQPGTRYQAIAAGAIYSLALKTDGTVVAWPDQSTVPANLTGVIAISAGGVHSLALRSDGTVVAWGGNAQGQSTVPGKLAGVSRIAGGGGHRLVHK